MIKERTLVCFLFLFLFLAIGSVGKLQVTLPDSTVEYRKFWGAKAHAPSEYDMIIAGDSRTYFSVSPVPMKKVLGQERILNFAFKSGGLNKEIYSLINQKLDPQAERKTIVLGVTPGSLSKDTEQNHHLKESLSEILGRPGSSVELEGLIESSTPMRPASLIRYLLGVQNYMKVNRLVHHDNGWIAAYPVVNDPGFMSRQIRATGAKVEPLLIKALLEQVSEWSGLGYEVYGFRPPTNAETEATEFKVMGFHEAKFVEAFEVAGGQWLDLGEEDYHSYDGSHIPKEEAIRLSVKLAREIAAKR